MFGCRPAIILTCYVVTSDQASYRFQYLLYAGSRQGHRSEWGNAAERKSLLQTIFMAFRPDSRIECPDEHQANAIESEIAGASDSGYSAAFGNEIQAPSPRIHDSPVLTFQRIEW